MLQVLAPPPTWTRPPVAFTDPALGESSALVASRAHPGVLWTLNDSDNPPELFAVDTAGQVLARIPVAGTENRDWEALALGPCPGRGREPLQTCLYIGDIGDNNRVRGHVVIYRVPEPIPGRDSVATPLDSLVTTYSDGPRDAESMVVDPLGQIWVISKELLRPPRLYRLVPRPTRTGRPPRLEFVTDLPIPSDSGVEEWTTDATWLADRKAIGLRTYGMLWTIPMPGGIPQAAATRPLCRLAGLGPQGEGLAWLGEDLFAVSSERLLRTPASIALIRCPARP